MPKYKCSICGCEQREVRYKYGFNNMYRYAVCNAFGHGDILDVPDYIPDEQIGRYLDAKV